MPKYKQLMKSIIGVVSFVMLLILFVKYWLNKKKYEDDTYLNNLKQVAEFLDLILSFSDYVTWVERDQIKLRYAVAGGFFKDKTNYYRKEETVKKFNEIFSDFDSYII